MISINVIKFLSRLFGLLLLLFWPNKYIWNIHYWNYWNNLINNSIFDTSNYHFGHLWIYWILWHLFSNFCYICFLINCT